MTVAELIEQLAEMPQDAIVVQSRDGEGNGFSPLSDVSLGRYEAETTYSGTYGLAELTETAIADGYGAADVPDGPLAICLWPIN